MTFASIPSGTSVFVDANVLVYSYGADPTYGGACTDLRERIELGDLRGFMTSGMLNEVGHRLMTLEACRMFGWAYAGIARRMRRHPAEIQKLQEFRKAMDEIVAIGVQVLPVRVDDVLTAGDLSLQYGLLSGDALIVAIMQAQGLTNLASNDADFDRVPGIQRCSPV